MKRVRKGVGRFDITSSATELVSKLNAAILLVPEGEEARLEVDCYPNEPVSLTVYYLRDETEAERAPRIAAEEKAERRKIESLQQELERIKARLNARRGSHET